MAAELHKHIGETVQIAGFLVHAKYVITMKKKERMYFGTFIDVNGCWIDTVHFPPSAKAYPFTGPGCYLINGKVTEELNHISIEVYKMHRLAMLTKDTADVQEAEAAETIIPV